MCNETPTPKGVNWAALLQLLKTYGPQIAQIILALLAKSNDPVALCATIQAACDECGGDHPALTAKLQALDA